MLVRQGGMKFGDVSLACGYNSYNGFLEAFKKYTGKTPEEYKKAVNLRQQNNNRL